MGSLATFPPTTVTNAIADAPFAQAIHSTNVRPAAMTLLMSLTINTSAPTVVARIVR